MNFYSLLYVKSNVLTDELLLIGIISNVESQPSFYFSENRLKLVGKSVNKNFFSGLKTSLLTIENEIEDLRKIPNSLALFDHPYSLDIIKKTALYKKNVLVFGAPCEIVLTKKLKLKELVKTLLQEDFSDRKIKGKVESFRKKWIAHQKKAKHPFKRKFTLTSDEISTIYSSHQIDLIGCFNDRIYTFHSIDFNSAPRTIEKNIFEYTRLVKGLELFGKSNGLKAGVHRLVYEHPKKKQSKELFYKAEDDKSKGFDFVRLKDFEREVKSLRLKGGNVVGAIFK